MWGSLKLFDPFQFMRGLEGGDAGGGGMGGGGAPTAVAEAPLLPDSAPSPFTPAPAAPADPAAAPKAVAPAAPEDPEFEWEPGKKNKRSEIAAWNKAHGRLNDPDDLGALMRVDEFVSKPGNEKLAEALVTLVRRGDTAKAEQIIALLNGQPAPAGPATNGAGKPAAGAPTPASLLPEGWDKGLDLDDPSIKGLHSIIASMAPMLTELSQFKNETSAERTARQAADEAKDADGRLNTQMDGAWTEHKFDEILQRFPVEDREEIKLELRNRILFAAIQSKGKLPLTQVAKTLRDRQQRYADGLIKAYVASKAGAPPGGGAGGGPVTTPAKPAVFGTELERAVAHRLGANPDIAP